MKIPISKLAAAFCVSFVLLLAACTAPAEQNTPDDTQSQTQETPETENQNNQQPQGGTEDEDVEENKTPITKKNDETSVWNLEGEIDTSDWTTFTNLKHGYSFKYPADKMEIVETTQFDPNVSMDQQEMLKILSTKLIFTECPNNQNINQKDCFVEKGFVLTDCPTKSNYGIQVFINIFENPNNLTPKEFFENRIGFHKWIFYDKETTIDNKTAYLVAFGFLDTYPNFQLYLKKSEHNLIHIDVSGFGFDECGYDFKSEMNEESEYFPHNFIKLGEAIFNTVQTL